MTDSRSPQRQSGSHCPTCTSPVVERDGRLFSVIDRSFVAERDRYRVALRRVLRDRGERDKVFAEVATALKLSPDEIRAIERGEGC